jgi:outer membrane murein-binding lipoprotein Lpp
MRHLAGPITAVLIGSVLPLSGCGERKKVTECNALVAVINEGVEEIQRGASTAPDGGPGAGELRTMAETMDGIAAKAAKLDPSEVELKKLSKDYEAMAKDIGTAARELATAFEKVDETAMRTAQEKMEKAVQKEEPLVESINKFCRKP